MFIRVSVGDQRSSLRVDFDRVRHPFHAYDLIRSWRQRAQESLQRDDPFEAFIFDWIAFNGWAERVTQAETDAEWLNALAGEPEIRLCFAEMLATNDRFAATCRRFAALWPIFRAEEQRRRDIQVGRARAAIVEDSLDAGIRHRPNCYGSHDGSVPLDWPHTLHALYQVRCNLFHGEKGVESDSDWTIVEAGVHVLSRFMSGSGYLG